MVASHGDGEDAGPAQVQPGPPRRCAWRATEGLHASNGPCTNGGRAWALAGMCQALIPVPIGKWAVGGVAVTTRFPAVQVVELGVTTNTHPPTPSTGRQVFLGCRNRYSRQCRRQRWRS